MQKSLRHVKGQAMVLFLGFAAAVIGMMLVAFNSGQVTNAKMRAMNAADAAAYSGAVWEARSLNFQAYMNRAMIVNEVTIAQSVTLRSWLDYMSRLVTNVERVGKYIPYVGKAITAAEKGLKAVDETSQKALGMAEDGLRALNLVEHGLQVSFNAGGAVIAYKIAQEVAEKNGAKFTPASVKLEGVNLASWMALTETYTKTNRPSIGKKGQDGRHRLRELALNSRDGFVEERDFAFKAPGVGFRKQGGTDLVDYDAWKALDSMWYCVELYVACPYTAPIAWGGAQAYSTRSPVWKTGDHGNVNEWRQKKKKYKDGQWANESSMNTSAKSPNANKLQIGSVVMEFPSYRDVQNFDKKNPKANYVAFAVEVMVDGADVKTAYNGFKAKVALTDGTTLEHDPQFIAKGGVYAMSEACVTFERPFDAPRADGGREFPSLFNPYWRASLATEDWKIRGMVDALKGIKPVAAVLSGTGSCRG